jgi:glutamyl-tRNA synthetase
VIEDSALCTAAADLLPDGELDGSVWPGWTKAVAEATGKKGRALFMPLRLAITGRSSGPEVASLLSFIGRERLIARLRGQET